MRSFMNIYLVIFWKLSKRSFVKILSGFAPDVIEKALKIFFIFFNQLVPNAPFLYLLKTSENCKILWYFQGVEKGWIWRKWVKCAKNFADLRLIYLLIANVSGWNTLEIIVERWVSVPKTAIKGREIITGNQAASVKFRKIT